MLRAQGPGWRRCSYEGVGGWWVGLASLPPLAPEPGNPQQGSLPEGTSILSLTLPAPALWFPLPQPCSATLPCPTFPPGPHRVPPGAGFWRKPRKAPALLLTPSPYPVPNIKLAICVSATLWPEAGEGLE